MSILDHVVYANQPKKAKVIEKTYPKTEKKYTTDPYKKAVPNAQQRKMVDIDPNRFKKLPGEKDQLKDMKADFRKKMRSVNQNLSNKEISNLFATKVIVTT